MCTGSGSTYENIRGKIPVKHNFLYGGVSWSIFIGTSELNKVTSPWLLKISERQTTYHETSFGMNFSEHINGISSSTVWNISSNKQDKCYCNHQFTLHIHEQTKNHYGEIRYEASKWYGINFWWVFGIKIMGRGGREFTNLLRIINLTWEVFFNLKQIQAWLNIWWETYQLKRLFKWK